MTPVIAATVEALLITLPVLVALAAVLLIGAAHRRDTDRAIGLLSRETIRQDRSTTTGHPLTPSGRDIERSTALARQATTTLDTSRPVAPEVWQPPDPETLGVTRRQFLNRSIVGASTFGLTAFGLSMIGFLWPTGSSGFGSKISVGSLQSVFDKIDLGEGFAYFPEGRMWITAYPTESLDKARQVYDPSVLAGMEAGIVALYQKCPHLGCRVPQCVTSQWFECPCHGSQYNQVGEKKGGPAPRGMDRFPVTVEGASVSVDTGVIVQGPPIGTNTTGQEAEGPHCIGAGAGEH
jgi:cytochrome b6-f complex iron-sulfur subunit